MPVERVRERIEIEARARIDGNLDRTEVEPLERLQRRIETGRFDGHDVAGPRDGHQAQVQRFERAVQTTISSIGCEMPVAR